MILQQHGLRLNGFLFSIVSSSQMVHESMVQKSLVQKSMFQKTLAQIRKSGLIPSMHRIGLQGLNWNWGSESWLAEPEGKHCRLGKSATLKQFYNLTYEPWGLSGPAGHFTPYISSDRHSLSCSWLFRPQKFVRHPRFAFFTQPQLYVTVQQQSLRITITAYHCNSVRLR